MAASTISGEYVASRLRTIRAGAWHSNPNGALRLAFQVQEVRIRTDGPLLERSIGLALIARFTRAQQVLQGRLATARDRDDMVDHKHNLGRLGAAILTREVIALEHLKAQPLAGRPSTGWHESAS